MAKQKQTKPINVPPARMPADNVSSKSAGAASRGVTDNRLIIILIAIAFIVNIRTVTYSYTYDDTVFATEATLIGLRGIKAIPALFTHAKNYNYDKSNTGSYRPLLPVTFAIEHEFFGFQPGISHFINLIIFGLMIMVLYKLLRRMFDTYSMFIPFFILLLFELHPIHTEVVANVKSRDELLTFLFTAMSMIQSFKYIDTDKNKHLILSGIYFLIALWAKESPVPFIAIVPMTLYFFTDAKISKLLIAAVPYVISCAIFVFMGYIFLDKDPKEAVVAITENSLVDAGLSDRLGTAFFIQLKYLGLLFFPHPLTFDYSYNQIPLIPVTHIKSLISLLVILPILAYAFITLKKKSIYSYAILYYFVALSITANIFIVIGTTMGERLLFIPSLGFCILVVFGLSKLLKTDAHTLTYSNSSKFAYVIITISVLYAGKTMARNEDWTNNMSLFSSGAEVSPDSWRAQFCVGAEYKLLALAETEPAKKAEYIKQAIKFFNASLAIYPNKPDTHADLGAMYLTSQQNDSAILHLGRAVQLNPRLSSAAANLGTVYLGLQKYPEAAYYYRKTIEVDPNNVVAVFNKGVCDYQFRQYDSAIYNFKQAIAISPDYNSHKAFEYTAMIYKMLGRMDSAGRYMGLARMYNPTFSL